MSTNPGLAAALGEENEFQSFTVVPDSYYPVTVTVLGVETSQSKVLPLAPGFPPVEQGYLPFAKLGLEITEGPFAGETINRNYYLNLGSAKNTKGGGIPLRTAACKALTGKGADDEALKEFGITWDDKRPGESDKNYAERARHAAVLGFLALEPEARIKFVTKFFRVSSWTGKSAIVHFTVSTYERRNDDGTPKVDELGQVVLGASNEVNGVFPMTGHEKVNIAFVRKFAFAKQEAEIKASANA